MKRSNKSILIYFLLTTFVMIPIINYIDGKELFPLDFESIMIMLASNLIIAVIITIFDMAWEFLTKQYNKEQDDLV